MGYYVYVMYDENENVLYVGKTTSMKRRMYQHFKVDFEDWKLDVKYIKYMMLKTEIDMSIYEIFLINKLKPKYNTSLRFKGETSINLRYTLIPYNYNKYSVISKEDAINIKNNLIIYEENKKSKQNHNSNYYDLKDFKTNKDYILSYNWCLKNQDNLNRLIANIGNMVRYNNIKIKNFAWTFYEDITYRDIPYMVKIKNGFNSNYTPNKNLEDINALAYLCNDFILDNNGVVDDNLSLLNLIDFIKRSAISKGEKVLIYLPSTRMRRLLREFLEREI